MARLELTWLASSTCSRRGVELIVAIARRATVLRGLRFVLKLAGLAHNARRGAVGRGEPLWARQALRGPLLVLIPSTYASKTSRRGGRLCVLSNSTDFAFDDP